MEWNTWLENRAVSFLLISCRGSIVYSGLGRKLLKRFVQMFELFKMRGEVRITWSVRTAQCAFCYPRTSCCSILTRRIYASALHGI